MGTLGRIVGMAWRHPRQLLAGYLCLLATSALALAVPRLLGSAVDSVLLGGSLRGLVTLALAILAVSALRGAFAYGQTYLGESLSQLVAYDLRNALYNQLQRLSFGFHDSQQTGNLMSKATADVEAVRMFIQTGVLRAGQIVVLLGGTVAIVLATNWRLGLVAVAVVPVVVWRSAVVNRALRRLWTYIQEVTGQMTTVLQENLSGVRVVRAFGAQEHEARRFDAVIVELSDSSIHANRLQAANTSVMVLLFAAAVGLVLWFGAWEVEAGRLTPGELASFIFYLGLLQGPVRMAGWIINSFSRAASAGQRVFAILDALSPVRERPDATPLQHVRGHVAFEGVSFAYDPSTPVLQDVSLEARPGQVIAVLGGPGSGKTTLVHLVPRFYDVTAGRVLLDGQDVRDVTLESLRRNVGIVMQDVFIFSATVGDNIRYGRPGASQAEVEEASRTSQLRDFIVGLPDGYDTWVGERGITLSGGQRQRLAIARTLLLDPPVLILDDSTSSVDAGTEHLLRLALARVMAGRTTFVIAHRLSTVLGADQVLVLEKGRVVQRGTHQELLEEEGPYRQVYQLQLLPQEAGAGAAAGQASGLPGVGGPGQNGATPAAPQPGMAAEPPPGPRHRRGGG